MPLRAGRHNYAARQPRRILVWARRAHTVPLRGCSRGGAPATQSHRPPNMPQHKDDLCRPPHGPRLRWSPLAPTAADRMAWAHSTLEARKAAQLMASASGWERQRDVGAAIETVG